MSIGYKHHYHATRNHYTPDAQGAADVQKIGRELHGIHVSDDPKYLLKTKFAWASRS